MERAYRSPYSMNMGIDYFAGYETGRDEEDETPIATSFAQLSNVLSSMRTMARYASASTDEIKDADIDEHDDDISGAKGALTPIDSYLTNEDGDVSPNLVDAATALMMTPIRKLFAGDDGEVNWKSLGQAALILLAALVCFFVYQQASTNVDIRRPDFVNQHPYVSSSYYASTQSLKTLLDTERLQVRRLGGKASLNDHKFNARVAVVRPFCEFDAEALPSTFAVWNQLPPCRASATDLDLDTVMERNETDDEDRYFDSVGSEIMQDMAADVFLFYSQTFSENEVAIKAVDTIIDQFNEPGGWSQCFANIYAIEANIPQELDLYIPSAQEELYNWVNGPNRQFEAAFRIIQSGEWGDYDGFYLMEGDSIPIKNNWLDVVLSEIESNRPFAILGA
jgi:hypothetical protein